MPASARQPHAPPLAGRTCSLAGTGTATAYAAALLSALGAAVQVEAGAADEHPALAAARGGLLALTGRADGPAQLCPAPLAACAEGVLKALRSISGATLPTLDGAMLLGERAAAFGHRRNGAVSAGGSCRLLPARDGALALNLARVDDWALLPAWLEADIDADWDAVAAVVAGCPRHALVERGRLLGLAVAAAEPPPLPPVSWYSGVITRPNTIIEPRGRAPLVIDLSSLWAGPLCGHVLHTLGARVLKVESLQRPDGARAGPAPFYDLLNAGKASVALDFATAPGRAQLRGLIERADIVIEASRPRALRQLGIDAEALVAARPGLTWISITGYGRSEPQAGWIAFGDDAGVAGGLTELMRTVSGELLFCGDAIADPLTGLHAALLAWSGYSGGGGVLALALRDVVAQCAQFELPAGAAAQRARYAQWQAVLAAADARAAPPQLRVAAGSARAFGADTQAVLRELDIPC